VFFHGLPCVFPGSVIIFLFFYLFDLIGQAGANVIQKGYGKATGFFSKLLYGGGIAMGIPAGSKAENRKPAEAKMMAV